MSYWILTIAGRVVSRTTVLRITNLERSTDEAKQRMKEFDERIRDLMKDKNHITRDDGERQLQDWDEYTDNVDQQFIDEFDNSSAWLDDKIPEEDQEFTPNMFDDTYLNKEIALPQGVGGGEDEHYGKATKRLRDAEGRPIGMANENPLLNTREYEVEFMDGHTEAITANLIAQHLYSQINEEGNRHMLLDDIIDHRRSLHVIDELNAQ